MASASQQIIYLSMVIFRKKKFNVTCFYNMLNFRINYFHNLSYLRLALNNYCLAIYTTRLKPTTLKMSSELK